MGEQGFTFNLSEMALGYFSQINEITVVDELNIGGVLL